MLLHIAVYASLVWIVYQYSKNYSVESFQTPTFPFISLCQATGSPTLKVNYVDSTSVYVFAIINGRTISGVYKFYEFNSYILGSPTPIDFDLAVKSSASDLPYKQITLTKAPLNSFYSPNNIPYYTTYPTSDVRNSGMIDDFVIDTIELNNESSLGVVIDLTNKLPSQSMGNTDIASIRDSSNDVPYPTPTLLDYDPGNTVTDTVTDSAPEPAAEPAPEPGDVGASPSAPPPPPSKPWWLVC